MKAPSIQNKSILPDVRGVKYRATKMVYPFRLKFGHSGPPVAANPPADVGENRLKAGCDNCQPAEAGFHLTQPSGFNPRRSLAERPRFGGR